jgi:hypothetical protein
LHRIAAQWKGGKMSQSKGAGNGGTGRAEECGKHDHVVAVTHTPKGAMRYGVLKGASFIWAGNRSNDCAVGIDRRARGVGRKIKRQVRHGGLQKREKLSHSFTRISGIVGIEKRYFQEKPGICGKMKENSINPLSY